MPYIRVLPRDLFNEADLLKCYGRLWIELDNRAVQDSGFVEEDVSSFVIEQDEGSGAITVVNLTFQVCGIARRLYRPLNARSAWSLYVETDDDELRVFDENGRVTDETMAFFEGRPWESAA